MAEKIKVLISEEEVDARIRELGEKISKEYEGKQIHLICVLKGGVFFMCELAKRITVPVSMDFMCVGSYGDGTKSSGVVRLAKDLDESIERREGRTGGDRRFSERSEEIHPGWSTYPERCSFRRTSGNR